MSGTYGLLNPGLGQRDHSNGAQLEPFVDERVRQADGTQQAICPAPQLQPIALGQVHRHLKNQEPAGSKDPDHIGDQSRSLRGIRLVLEHQGRVNEVSISGGK